MRTNDYPPTLLMEPDTRPFSERHPTTALFRLRFNSPSPATRAKATMETDRLWQERVAKGDAARTRRIKETYPFESNVYPLPDGTFVAKYAEMPVPNLELGLVEEPIAELSWKLGAPTEGPGVYIASIHGDATKRRRWDGFNWSFSWDERDSLHKIQAFIEKGPVSNWINKDVGWLKKVSD